MGDKLKVAFLGLTDKGKERLARRRDERAERATSDLDAVRTTLASIPNATPAKAGLAVELELNSAAVRAAKKREAKDGYKALAGLCDAVEDLRRRTDTAAGTVKEQPSLFQLIDLNLNAVRRAALMTPDETAATVTLQALDPLEAERRALNGPVDPIPKKARSEKLLEQALTLRDLAEKSLETIARPDTPRAKSREVLGAMSDVEGLDGILDPERTDPRGRRNAAQESAARLNVFDAQFVHTGTDKAATIENESMRAAAVIRAAAMQQAQTRNDPKLAHRLGALMIDEYGPDLKMSEDTAKLTKALVMDDPVEKLLTGKIRPEDAVERIRDQAAVGGVSPPEMLRMLRNQFEMRMASLDPGSDVEFGALGSDTSLKGDKQAFVLRDLEGEVDPELFKGAELFAGGSPAFKNGNLKYAGRGKELMDAIEHVIDAWETELGDSPPDALGAQEPSFSGKGKPKQPPTLGLGSAKGGTTPGITPETLAAAANLSPAAERKAVKALDPKTGKVVERDLEAAPYLAAPGLGQEHAVRGPLANGDDRAARHGAMDEREYAHLRMLQRADEEDRDRKVDYKGQQLTPEEVVRAYMAQAYTMTATQVDDMLSKVAAAFANVPLTITFTAESMFGSKKSAPTHGTEYVSDVVYTRGQEAATDLVGRGNNIGIAPSITLLDMKIAEKEAEVAELKLLLSENDLKGEPTKPLEKAVGKAEQTLAKLRKKQTAGEEADAKVGTTGGGGGDGWKNERGVNYQRWRSDKDRREGRLDERMLTGNAQTFGAVNPSFEHTQGSAAGGEMDGTNYYGNAHFLLADQVRGRAAFSVRGGGISVGGGKSSVQRTDLMMMLYDMVVGGGKNQAFIDAIALLAKGGAKALATTTDWEIHIYGGFDMTKDATAIFLSSKVQEPVRGRIERFAKKNGLSVENSMPDGKDVVAMGRPAAQELTP